MKYEELKKGLLIRVIKDHESGYGGRKGIVLEVGIFSTLGGARERTGARIDIGLAGPIVLEAEFLEKREPDPSDSGWEEIDV